MKVDGRRPGALRSVLSGVLAGALALGVAELAASFVRPQAAPLIAIGGAGIDLTPEWLKSFAIRTFGENDKPVLLGSLLIGAIVFAGLLGLVGRFNRVLAAVGFGLFGLLGAVAALSRPDADAADVIPVVLGTLAGIGGLLFMLRAAVARTAARSGAEPSKPTEPPKAERSVTGPADRMSAATASSDTVSSDNDPSDTARPESGAGTGRRAFLVAAGGTAAVAASTEVLGRVLNARGDVAAARRALKLPAPASPAEPLPAGVDLRVPGLTPFTTANKNFYRVDTALVLPQVDPGEWTLRVHGMVDRPFEITFDELLRRPLLERDITMTCVSNEVGGPYASHARWLGVSLPDLLRQAGVQKGADQILSRSTDGMTISTPLATVLDGRDALLAVGMNGEPLPVANGFPARMIVPGLFGYVSGTKWVTDLKVTRYAADKAYWTKRDWDIKAPILTMSRIDVPKPFAQVKAGRVPVAGMAWAQHRGVEAVEVRVDGGPWRRAKLAPVPNTDTWRQWFLEWDATAGSHRLEARATDASGAVQPEKRATPFPRGATGWHSTVVTVT